MRRLRLLSSARTDLIHILDYVTRQSGSVAIGVLRDQCKHLAELPGTLGRPRPELGRDIRSFPFQGYMIFFRYVEGVLEIINIIEGHRDIETHFGRTDRER